MVFERGEIFIDVWGLKVVVLGGPQRLYMMDYYTVRYLEDKVGTDIRGNQKIVQPKGSTTLMPLHSSQWRYSDMEAAGSNSAPYSVVYGHCGECDEPDMIFYNDDYICAWCREHLEEEIC